MSAQQLSRLAAARNSWCLRPRLTIRPKQPVAPRTKSTNSAPASRSSGKDAPSPADCIPTPNSLPQQPISIWQRLGPLTTACNAYGRAQKRRPYVTQFFTSLVIYFFGDLSAQYISDDKYDPKRTARSLTIGGIASIPSYKWFLFLGQHFNYGSHMLSLAVKIVVNQSLFTPFFNSYFFGMHSLLSGDTLDQVVQRIRTAVPRSIVNSWKLWPAVTAFSFTFVPPEYRSSFAGIIAVGWQTYLGLLNRQAEMLARGEVEEDAVPGHRVMMEDKST